MARITIDPDETPRFVLEQVLVLAEEMARDVPDHMCGMTEHESEFWDLVRAARRYLEADRKVTA